MNNYASMRNGAGVQGNLVLGTHVYHFLDMCTQLTFALNSRQA